MSRNEDEDKDGNQGLFADDADLDDKERRLLRIFKLQEDLHKINVDQARRDNFKWYAASATSVAVMLLVYFAILPGINFLFLSTKNASELRAALNMNNDFIPENADIKKAISDEILITAWDLNNRSPRFFTKKNFDTYKEKNFQHNLRLFDMTWASANTPYYFKPAVIEDNTYISGDNMAISPALFSYYYATEKVGKADNDIRIVSVGSTNELAEKIDTKASLLDWAVRLTTLSAPVKKHTMDYMVQHLLNMGGEQLHKYELDMTKDWESEFYYTSKRLPTLKDIAQQLIFSKRDDVEEVLEMIVKEKRDSFKKQPGDCNNQPR